MQLPSTQQMLSNVTAAIMIITTEKETEAVSEGTCARYRQGRDMTVQARVSVFVSSLGPFNLISLYVYSVLFGRVLL